VTDPAFDRVVVVVEGQRRELSAAAFLKLPLPERIKHVLGRSIEFYLGPRSVERGDALKSMNQAR